MRDFEEIIADYFKGELLSDEELHYLKKEFESSNHNSSFVWQMKKIHTQQPTFVLRNRDNVFEKIERVVTLKRRRRVLLRLSAIVASLLLLSGLFMILAQEERQTQTDPLLISQTGIVPGAPRAELILADGQVILLAEQSESFSIDADGKIRKDENTLIYDFLEQERAPEYHQLIIPRGGEFTLVLSDGTRVFLNAATTIRYPDRFIGETREVTLIGEAFFEVVANPKQPFVVKTGDILTYVVGTSFNINAYPDREEVVTTLVEGSVCSHWKDKKNFLVPGTQAIYNLDNGDVKIHSVDTENYTSWKDGYYLFDDTSLEEMMYKLSLWYDMELVYISPEVKHIKFGGRLKRYDNVESLLENLEYTRDVKFVIKDKTISIKKHTD